ncbi:MAG: hypothetical protein ABFD52_05415 [Acidobacteriota bacterium]
METTGVVLIDLLKGDKAQYSAADTDGRRAILLAVLIDKVVCRPTESYVSWREPFGMLISMNRVSEEKLKGE